MRICAGVLGECLTCPAACGSQPTEGGFVSWLPGLQGVVQGEVDHTAAAQESQELNWILGLKGEIDCR